jgi:hypothetical protein
MGIYNYNEAKQLLKMRRRVLKATWKAIDACVPHDNRPGPSPDAERLLFEALELRAQYVQTHKNCKELQGNNILIENTRDLVS